MKPFAALLIVITVISCKNSENKGEASSADEQTAVPLPISPDHRPEYLSKAGIFLDLATLQPHSSFLAYEINHEFWSDFGTKKRWALTGAPGIRQENANWQIPVGSTFIKHFEMPTSQVDLSQIRSVETRVLVKSASGWIASSYIWNEAQTEATLAKGGETIELSIQRGTGPDKVINWTVPSEGQCFSCHNEKAGVILGVRPRQLNRPNPSGEGNQLELWQDKGWLQGNWSNDEAKPYPSRQDANTNAEALARAYLEVNCGFCHQPEGFERNLNLSWSANLQSLQDASFFYDDLGIADAKIVAPGIPEQSLLWLRMSRTDRYRMPYISSYEVDERGLAIIADWIQSLPSP
ncbi:hypothetical protein [Pseudobacteriovorax antillogorgiicola]|uniref:Cytochrome c domain-containing protein n=1 Tax=Pseudobacteriovorax antillogorgiicola TaxID=1513793 RepID=A0A1Y6CNU0_9BACT|nr:hypothetical protein [Pseudobacteriovorax antillogorgiicola]TCS44785.1 putative repeat protein (TIGR03806 family) [Pseudobacteriovorax antillogorgiicola]SMF77473.1 conserved hypothetical protein, HNE_0200 family [Pseudobacteriovorax antillogorgiicola]